MDEREGHYEKTGDVEEWVWDDEAPDAPTLTGGWVVPEAEFDPTLEPAADVTSPSEKAAEANTSPGLQVAEQETIEEVEEEEIEEEDDLESLTKEELQEMLAERGLPTSGNKPELIERLAE